MFSRRTKVFLVLVVAFGIVFGVGAYSWHRQIEKVRAAWGAQTDVLMASDVFPRPNVVTKVAFFGTVVWLLAALASVVSDLCHRRHE